MVCFSLQKAELLGLFSLLECQVASPSNRPGLTMDESWMGFLSNNFWISQLQASKMLAGRKLDESPFFRRLQGKTLEQLSTVKISCFNVYIYVTTLTTSGHDK